MLKAALGRFFMQKAWAHLEVGQITGAKRAVNWALCLNRRDPALLNMRGVVALRENDALRARDCFGAAKNICPTNSLYHFNFGNSCLALNDLPVAARAFENACEISKDYAEAWKNLGLTYYRLKWYEKAARSLELACKLKNGNDTRLAWIVALTDSGISANNSDQLKQARELINEWNWSEDASKDIYTLKARIAYAQGLWSEAVDYYLRLIALDPDHPGYHNNIARCMIKLGRMAEAAEHFSRTHELAPDFTEAWSGMLGCLNYLESHANGQYKREIDRWEQTIASRYSHQIQEFDNDRSYDRPLRIGYLSPDLRQHVVGKLFLPVLKHHDRNLFFTACYHTEPRKDSLSSEIEKSSSLWRHLHNINDAEIADIVRRDRIDILVDLSGHTAYARPLVFARKPAPVQVSWLGYFNSTGMKAMDWFFTDKFSSGPDQEAHFSERLYQLPHTRLSYEPYPGMPNVGDLPAVSTGRITFGCLNNLGKINPIVLDLWAKILKAVPNSRLLIQNSSLGDGPNRQRFQSMCIQQGIDVRRLELRPALPIDEFARTYLEIDVALDPFPFCGGVTSFDALWMGVPVITLEQYHLAGKQTSAMLRNLQLETFVAHSFEDYVAIAKTMSGNLDHLKMIRSELRQRFMHSPLADHAALAQNLESAYRTIWGDWLDRSGG